MYLIKKKYIEVRRKGVVGEAEANLFFVEFRDGAHGGIEICSHRQVLLAWNGG